MKKIKKIIIGTNNPGKYKELGDLLPKKIQLLSPKKLKPCDFVIFSSAQATPASKMTRDNVNSELIMGRKTRFSYIFARAFALQDSFDIRNPLIDPYLSFMDQSGGFKGISAFN